MRTIEGHPATGNEEAQGIDRRQPMPGRERDDQIALNDRQWGCRHDQAAIRLARERCDGALDFAGVAHADRTQRNSTPNAAITPRNAASWPMPDAMVASR